MWWAELYVTAPSRARRRSDPFCSLLAAASGRDGDRSLQFRARRRWWRTRPVPFLLAAPELAGVLPAPDTIFWPPSRSTGRCEGIAIGTDAGGRSVELPVPAAEGRHALIVGETGMGKSSLLLRLAAIGASLGSVVLFDPIGDSARTFLARLPAPYRRRVVWIAPEVSPVAIDLVAALRDGGPGSVAAERAVADVVDALRRVRAARYADTPFWGPRIEETVRSALRAAAAIPGATIVDAERLLATTPRQLATVPPEAREAVETLRARVLDRPEEVDGSRRLLHELTERPALRELLGQRNSRFSPASLHEPRRIVLITGEAAAVGESSARYLLAVHLALFWSSRQRLQQPTKTFLVLDEAQWYAHESLAEMLRLGRRANVHVWLATQSLAALPEGVREAVRTNVADIAAFRGSPEDARDIARLSAAITEQGVAALPRGEAALLIGKGERVGFVRTDPPRDASPAERRDAELEALEASRRFWSPDALEEAATPAAAVTDATVRPVALVLWAGLLEAAEAPTLRVRLEPLRRACDPEGDVVRALGRRLRELDLLRGAGHGRDGAYWEVAREGMDRLLGGSVGPEELAAASAAWRRVIGPA